MREARKAKAPRSAPGALVADLRQSDDFTRARIIEELLAHPSRELADEVVTLLDDRNTSVRMDALDMLRKMGDDALDAVIKLLYHENEDLRVYGCEVLPALGRSAALPHLIEKVHEENENVKNAAVVALGEFNDRASVDTLLEVLDQEEWAAFSAIYSLAKIGNKRAVPALMNVFKHGGEELSFAACEALMSFRDSRIVDGIVDFVKTLEKEKKSIFIRIIIEHGPDQMFQKLAAVMGEDLLGHLLNYLKVEKRKSVKVVDLLVHFRHPDSARAMLDILKDMDPDGEEYEHIMRLFMELKDVWSDGLVAYLSAEEYAMPAVRACGGVGRKIDDQLLLGVFRASPLPTKREIMKQLGRITNGNGHKIIREAMSDADGHVQAEAVAIAGTIPMRELIPDVLLKARKGFADVRTKALLALLRLDPAVALHAIDRFVKDGSAEDKKIYLAVTPHIDKGTNFAFLQRLIGDADERVRQTAIRVIGNFVDDRKYLDLFKTVLKSGTIPHEVLKVIGEKRLSGFRHLLVEIGSDPLQNVWTRYHALAALSAFGDPSLFALFAGGLKDESNLIKIASLKGLSELADRRAVPYIKPFTKSLDEDVKNAARMALTRLPRSEGVC